MSQALIDKINKEREIPLEIDGVKITARRPTHLQMAELDGKDVAVRDLLRLVVVDWEMTEMQLFAGGTPKAVPFSSDLFMAWVEDKPTAWKPVINAALDAYRAHKQKLEDELVKSGAG